MPLTLWLGERPLGEIHPRAPMSGWHFEGVLLPEPGHPPLASLWQVRIPPLGQAVFEHALESDIVAERGTRVRPVNPGPVTLTPMSRDEARGVPFARRLHVRDGAGAALPVTHVMLLEHRPDPAASDPELAALPPASLAGGSVWLVAIRFEPDSPAPLR